MPVMMILVLVPLAVLAFKGFGVEGPSALHVETTGKMPRDSTSWAPKASSQGVSFTLSLEILTTGETSHVFTAAQRSSHFALASACSWDIHADD